MVKLCFHAHILLVVDEIFVHEKCSHKIYCPSKTVNRQFIATQKPLIDTFLVIKVIISYDNFSDFHGQNFSRQQEPGLREKIRSTENMINV